MIPLFKVYMSKDVDSEILNTLHSGFIAEGARVKELELKIGEFLGVKNVTCLNSATSGLQLALRLLNIGMGDSVISTPLTCTATNWPIVNCGADIIWNDVERSTCNIDVSQIENNIQANTKAIIVVHWGGYPCDLNRLSEISWKYNIPVIEDCAHAFGSEYFKQKIGGSGNICVFSFQAIKHVTAGDGGCIVVPNKLYERARRLKWFGINRDTNSTGMLSCSVDIQEAGFKYNMNDIAATIGLANIVDADDIITKHRDNASYYNRNLSGVGGVSLLDSIHSNSAYWLYTIRVKDRDNFIKHMLDKHVSTSVVHSRNDKHSCVSRFTKSLPNLDAISREMVCIPVGWWVANDDREYIVDCIKQGW